MASSEPKLRDLFSKALQCPTAEAQAAFVRQACQGDADLHSRLAELLEAHGEAGSFLKEPSAPRPLTIDLPRADERPGAVIGPYKLLQEIGEGGMGTVFMAEQSVPVQRKIALKIVKPGMDSRQVIARFEAERQALAMMDHPNIAKVLDAGTTDAGRPYFVMELVKGVPITKFCDDRNLTPKERLALFIPVCHAVQHAHQKGIIHRDLKPSNVMVACYDDRPVPKVIDFGVAKATGQKLTERTLFTQFGQVVGTLEYMSPEQATLNALDIDARSDIYSLGILLYELLTGSTPLETKRIKEAAFDEVLRLIREEETPPPSTRLLGTAELPDIATHRKTEPAKLSHLMRGELDWIALKALDKDRNRRYETAKGFAADVERYLKDEPVQACPPSVAYRARKFVKRHKGKLILCACVLLALIGNGVGWFLVPGKDPAQVTVESARRDVERNPQAANKWQILARAQYRAGDYQASLESLDKSSSIEVHEGNSWVWFLAVMNHWKLGHKDRARNEYDRAVIWMDLNYPSDNGLHQSRTAARQLIGATDLPRPMKDKDRWNIANPDDAKASPTDLAKAEELASQWNEIIADCTRLIASDPTKSNSFYRRALAYEMVGQWKKALDDYTAVVNLDRGYASIWFQRAGAHNRLDQLGNAIDDYTEFLWLTPKFSYALEMRGNAYYNWGQYAKAIEDFSAHLTIIPYITNDWQRRGLAYNLAGQREKALADFGKTKELWLATIKARPHDPLSYTNPSRRLSQFPDPDFHDSDWAIELAHQAIELKRNDPSHWRYLGQAQYRAGAWKESIEALNKSMVLGNGGTANEWFFVAMAEWQLGNKDEAHKQYRRAVKWMEISYRDQTAFRRFRAEAAKLLGIDDQPKAEK